VFKLATVPVTVKEPEPLVPVVKLKPVVEPSASVPCETDSESASGLEPAAESVKEIALPLPLEKASDAFSLNDAEPGALIAGALRAVTVSATLVEADRVSPGSVTETDNESGPE
jgi:hypothetical protein